MASQNLVNIGPGNGLFPYGTKSLPKSVLTWSLTHWGRDKMDATSQTTFSSAFFLNENVWFPIKISLKFVPKDPINNIPSLIQIMAWRRPGDKPLSEPMMVSLPTHICVARPQWVNKVLWQSSKLKVQIIYFENYTFRITYRFSRSHWFE